MTSFRLAIIASVNALALVAAPSGASAQSFEILQHFVEPPRQPTVSVSDPDGSVYGWFTGGGPQHGGGIFRLAPDGTFTVLYTFDVNDPHGIGFFPTGLVRGADGALYGTNGGGVGNTGTLFRLAGGTVTVLYTFRDRRASARVAGPDGMLYGTTWGDACGSLFRFDPIGAVMTTLHSFSCGGSSGKGPSGSLVIEPDGSIFGITQAGGASGYGTIYRWDSSGVADVHHFDRTQGVPVSLSKGTGASLYGTTCCTSGNGKLFRFVMGSSGTVPTFTALHTVANFSNGLVVDADDAVYGTEYASPPRLFKWHGETMSVLHTFSDVDGDQPSDRLVLGADGKIVGAAQYGGLSRGEGTIFSVRKDGTGFSAFSLGDGGALHPFGPIVRMPDGTIYGTTDSGGSSSVGTLYRRDATGRITVLHEFSYPDAAIPTGVVLGTNGKLYGTTQYGGAAGRGTIFEWDGTTLRTVHSFEWDDASPSALMAARDGSLYGTTRKGGADNGGTLFRWSEGTFDVLHHFTRSTGLEPYATVIEGTDGALYGVTSQGGESFGGVVFKWVNGAYTVLHSFATPEGGLIPGAPLVQGVDGTIFGTTMFGGTYDGGTLFKLTETSYTVLHSFAVDQGVPFMPLVRLPDGSIVGATAPVFDGFSYRNFGSIFRWNGEAISTVQLFDTSGAYGRMPSALGLGSDGNLYGATWMGGVAGGGTLFRVAFNPAPIITNVAAPTIPLAINTPVTITTSFVDAELSGHTCTFAWGDGVISTTTADTPGTCSANHVFTDAGVYTVNVTVIDAFGLRDSEPAPFTVIYDPSAGFVTGNGWIQSSPGAYAADPTLAGRADFAFVSRYRKGTSLPSGNTEFQFEIASFNFVSVAYDWLVVSGPRAQFKGRGTVNGQGDYEFLLSVTDGDLDGGRGADQFRIKIWHRASGAIIYDNVAGASDAFSSANPQAIGAGSIVIHAK